MKRISRSMIGGLLTFASVCLLTPAVANAAPPGNLEDHKALKGNVHLVAGSAYTSFFSPEEEFQLHRQFAVVDTGKGVHGHVRVDYWNQFLGEIFEVSFVLVADCLDVEEETGQAWIGGEVVDVTTNFGFPWLGMKMVFYVEDNHGGNPLDPDIHGSYWGPPDKSCYERPAPWFPDPSERGKVVVK